MAWKAISATDKSRWIEVDGHTWRADDETLWTVGRDQHALTPVLAGPTGPFYTPTDKWDEKALFLRVLAVFPAPRFTGDVPIVELPDVGDAIL